MNIATGTVASKEVADDIRDAHKKGETEYLTFMKERLECDEPTKKFHDPMKKASLKTFESNVKKQKSTFSDGISIILKADWWLFGRMIVMGQSRNLNLKDLMCFPLGSLPWSLASPDGSLRKTNKAALSNKIKKDAQLQESLPILCHNQ